MTEEELHNGHRRLNQEIAEVIIQRMPPGDGLDCVSVVYSKVADRCRLCRIFRTEETDSIDERAKKRQGTSESGT